MSVVWLGIALIVVALGWLYFSAKLRTLRLRVPPAQRQVPLPASSNEGSSSAVRNEKS